ncbi:MAG: hypothetical protein VZR09_03035 [Candidatus Gastranaerophilaceae bacterium]|jgi:ribulose bisphosphate carboxylase small subunit|nr:hypothetical protein [Candidatus Gastranaerophilaceae bacterium]
MKVLFNLASVKPLYKNNVSKVAFGESDYPNYSSRERISTNSKLYKEIKTEQIREKYYNKFKTLYELSDAGKIDNNMFWIMNKRLEAEKAAELANLERSII